MTLAMQRIVEEGGPEDGLRPSLHILGSLRPAVLGKRDRGLVDEGRGDKVGGDEEADEAQVIMITILLWTVWHAEGGGEGSMRGARK